MWAFEPIVVGRNQGLFDFDGGERTALDEGGNRA
jgi:hypothetical protein